MRAPLDQPVAQQPRLGGLAGPVAALEADEESVLGVGAEFTRTPYGRGGTRSGANGPHMQAGDGYVVERRADRRPVLRRSPLNGAPRKRIRPMTNAQPPVSAAVPRGRASPAARRAGRARLPADRPSSRTTTTPTGRPPRLGSAHHQQERAEPRATRGTRPTRATRATRWRGRRPARSTRPLGSGSSQAQALVDRHRADWAGVAPEVTSTTRTGRARLHKPRGARWGGGLARRSGPVTCTS